MRIVLSFVGLLVSFWLFFTPTTIVYAQCGGCEVSAQCENDPETGQCEFLDGCSCTTTSCGSGTYTAPDGTCHVVGTDYQCGDWYACGTVNNPAKMCKVECGGGGGTAACFPATVNCPTGTARSTTIVDSFCSRQTIPGDNNTWEMCVGLGSAQLNSGVCCYSISVQTDDCWITPSGVEKCKSEQVCLNNTINTYSCVSTCNAPTAPTLTSPANGAQLASTNVSLLWNGVTFSAGCSGTYRVYVGTSNPPTTLSATTASNVTNSTFVGAVGTTYYWYVQAMNGPTGASSAIRSFTILNDQITGTVYYDAGNNCSGNGWSSGGFIAYT